MARLDRYDLLAHIADGAEAEVHLARDTDSGREVVVKIPHRRTLENPQLAARWRRESRITRSLDHPYIVRRLDGTERHSQPYSVYEYVSGGNLRSALKAGPLPPDTVVRLGTQLAEALAYLHGSGIVHRDLKPENLLRTAGGDLRLADFGAATPLPRWGLGVGSAPEGTVGYLSPEELQGRPPGCASDVYGWGVTMYELLSGRDPFPGSTPEEVAAAQMSASVEPVSAAAPSCPAAFAAVVTRAMRRDRAVRYPDGAALLADLRRLDGLDLAGFDLAPDPPLGKVTIGAGEFGAVMRLSLVIAGVFIVVVAMILAVSAVAR